MSVLTQRRNVSKAEDRLSTPTSSPASSANSSSDDLQSMDDKANTSKGKSLLERSRIPNSFYLTVAIIFLLQYWAGWHRIETIQSWYRSVKTSAHTAVELLGYTLYTTKAALKGELVDHSEYLKLAIVCAVTFSMIYVFFLAPFRAGLWTGARAKRHKVHRYMGLMFLMQYFFAWIEFSTNYENGGAHSVLPHFISLNGEFAELGLAIS